MTDTDGNIGTEVSMLSEKICGMLFDVASAGSLANKVIEINSIADATEAGITPDVCGGVPLYHIEQFYNKIGASAKLYVMFKSCTVNDWSAIRDLQNAANGQIGQFGIWTEKELWTASSTSVEKYGLSEIVKNINAQMVELANTYYAPASAVLCANTSRITPAEGSAITTIDIAKIPTCVQNNCRYVSIAIGQAATEAVQKMQKESSVTAPVGTTGLILACLYDANVGESIGHVRNFNIMEYFPEGKIELGFGDATINGEKITNATPYESLTRPELNKLDDLGFIFPIRYAGNNGVYFNGDTTCSAGDYRTIGRNRTINKSRRLVRGNLLQYVNAPFKVDPATGYLSPSQSAIIASAAKDALNLMLNNGEVSAIGSVTVPANQNILKNDKINLSYSLIPLGASKSIYVTEGLALNI